MKSILVFAALAATLAWLVLKPSALDKLSAPPSAANSTPAGNIFVDVDPALLPVRPLYFRVPGRPTVVVFHDDTCPACHDLDRDLADFNRQRPDVAIRKVHIRLGSNAYAQAIRDYRWQIFMVPCVLVFDANGTLLAGDEKLNAPGTDLLYAWMNREARRAADKAG